jgi:hypothetical protein
MAGSPYSALRQALRARGGAATSWEVRKELAEYLKGFKVVAKTPEGRVIDWNDLYTREEWHAIVNRRKKKGTRKRRNKQGDLILEYDAHEDRRVEARVIADSGERADDMSFVDAFAKRQQEEWEADQYQGEW